MMIVMMAVVGRWCWGRRWWW